MGRKVTKKPSFFKVLLDGFANQMRIPNKFTKNHIPPSLEKCVLRGPCGKRRVKLVRRKNGLLLHNHGWRGFVKDHRLQFGDFLVFRYDGKEKFRVEIYDGTCCEIDVEAPKKRNDTPMVPSTNEGYRFAGEKDAMVDDHETKSCSSDSENADMRRGNNYMSGTEKRLKVEDVTEKSTRTRTRTIIFKSTYSCFRANVSTRSARYRVGIPKDLVDTKGLRNKETIDIEDSSGKLWPAELVSRIGSRDSTAISTGWGECSKANNVVVGDIVVFEFVAETVLRLHVFRKGVKARGGDNRPISVVLDAPNIENKS